MSLRLSNHADGDAATSSSTDEVLLDLIRIVRGARHWCADVLPAGARERDGVARSLRDAAAALVPITPGPGGVAPDVVVRSLVACRAALALAHDALDVLRAEWTPAHRRRRRRRCVGARTVERALALGVLRLAVGRAIELTDAALDAFDVSNTGDAVLPSTPNPRSDR